MNKASRVLFLSLLVFGLVLVAACSQGAEDNATPGDQVDQSEEGNDDSGIDENGSNEAGQEELSGELVVYSSRNENFVQPLLDRFSEETGINVRALHGDEASVNRISEEANNVQADIFISNDIGAMEFLRLEGLLQGFDPQGAETIDDMYRAEDNSWIGLSARSRGLIYNRDQISEEEMPTTLEELAEPRWEGEFMITRGGNGSMIAHVSGLRNEWGDEQTLEWLSQIKDNAGSITDGHGDIRRAVGSGEYKFGLVNNYYYHQQLNEETDNNVGFIYPDQEDDEMGVFVNAAGVALINDGPNQENGKYFIEWLLTDEGQQEFSFESMEVPLNPEIQATEGAAQISDYKVMDMPLSDLGQVWTDTLDLIEESGLDLEIR